MPRRCSQAEPVAWGQLERSGAGTLSQGLLPFRLWKHLPGKITAGPANRFCSPNRTRVHQPWRIKSGLKEMGSWGDPCSCFWAQAGVRQGEGCSWVVLCRPARGKWRCTGAPAGCCSFHFAQLTWCPREQKLRQGAMQLGPSSDASQTGHECPGLCLEDWCLWSHGAQMAAGLGPAPAGGSRCAFTCAQGDLNPGDKPGENPQPLGPWYL